jgi:antitoxin component YwqK of YwqJK toxin-antitoxin module
MKKITLLILFASFISNSQTIKTEIELDQSLFSTNEEELVLYKGNLFSGDKEGFTYENGRIKSGKFFGKDGIDNEFEIIPFTGGSDSTRDEYCEELMRGFPNDFIDCKKYDLLIKNYYYENGEISSITTTLNFNKIRQRFYYPNGIINYDFNLLDDIYHGDFISYYPSGVVRSKVNYKNGKEHGEWRYFYENGNLKSQMTYIDGNVVDKSLITYYESGYSTSSNDCDDYYNQTVYHHNGKKYYDCQTGFYYTENGELTGKIEKIGTNKVINESGSIINGLRIGLWKSFDSFGNITAESNYSNGKLEGKTVGYDYVYDDITGNPLMKIIKNIDNYNQGKVKGKQYWYEIVDFNNVEEHMTVYKNGVVKKEEFEMVPVSDIVSSDSDLIYDYVRDKIKVKKGITYYKKIPYSGDIFFLGSKDSIKSFTDRSVKVVNGSLIKENGYYNTGELSYNLELVDGVPYGNETGYYKTGEVRYVAEYINGELNGTETGYYETGEINHVVNRGNNDGDNVYLFYDKNGVELNGFVITKYESGVTRNSGVFINGKPDGFLKTYDEDGVKSSEFNFKIGVLDGKQIYYNTEGDSEEVEFYENGVLIQE